MQIPYLLSFREATGTCIGVGFGLRLGSDFGSGFGRASLRLRLFRASGSSLGLAPACRAAPRPAGAGLWTLVLAQHHEIAKACPNEAMLPLAQVSTGGRIVRPMTGGRSDRRRISPLIGGASIKVVFKATTSIRVPLGTASSQFCKIFPTRIPRNTFSLTIHTSPPIWR